MSKTFEEKYEERKKVEKDLTWERYVAEWLDAKRSTQEYWDKQYNWYIKSKTAVEERTKEVIENHEVMELNKIAAWYADMWDHIKKD